MWFYWLWTTAARSFLILGRTRYWLILLENANRENWNEGNARTGKNRREPPLADTKAEGSPVARGRWGEQERKGREQGHGAQGNWGEDTNHGGAWTCILQCFITYQATESKPGALLRRVELVVLGCIWLYDWYFMLTPHYCRMEVITVCIYHSRRQSSQKFKDSRLATFIHSWHGTTDVNISWLEHRKSFILFVVGSQFYWSKWIVEHLWRQWKNRKDQRRTPLSCY